MKKNPETQLDRIENAIDRLLNACNSDADVLKSMLKPEASPNLENRTKHEQDVPSHEKTEEEIMAKEHRMRVIIGTDDRGKSITRQLSARSELELADKVIRAVVASGRIKEFIPDKAMAATEQPAQKKTNFKTYAEHWRSTYKKGREKNTDVFLTSKLHVLYQWFGDMDIEDIAASDVQNFLNERAAQYKKATVKGDWGVLKEILDSAVDDDIILKNPAKNRRLHNPAEEGGGTKALTKEQYMSILRAIPTLEDDRERCLIALLANTSMRREEALGLRWENVDFENRVIYIREALVFATTVSTKKKTKTESSERTFPMNEQLYSVLLGCRKEQGYVIPGRGDGPISSATYTRLWRSLEQHIELYGMTAINFRTTFATMAVASGVDIRTTQSLMGHSTPDMTLKVYAKQEDTRLPVAMVQMDAFLQGSNPQTSKNGAV